MFLGGWGCWYILQEAQILILDGFWSLLSLGRIDDLVVLVHVLSKIRVEFTLMEIEWLNFGQSYSLLICLHFSSKLSMNSLKIWYFLWRLWPKVKMIH